MARGDSLYWTVSAYIARARIDGSGVATFAAGALTRGVAVDGSSVYWTEYDTAGNNDGIVKKAPRAGGPPTTLASTQADPTDIAADGTNVYWLNTGDQTVMRVPVAGGSPTTLASQQAGVRHIAVDDTSVYWTDFDGGTVMKLTPK